MGRSESERKGYINLVRILRYMTGKDVAYLVLCVLLIAAQVYLDLRIPDYMSAITTEIEMVGGSFDNVVDDGYGMIFCALGSLASSIATGFIAAGLASTLCKRIRAKEFENVERFSEGDMNRFSTASLITRSTNDITQIQLFVAMGLQIIVKAPIMAVWAVLKIAGKSWQWSAITVAAVVAMLVIVACVMYFAIPRFKRIQWMTDDVNRVVRENLNGVRVVRAYNAEGYQEDKFGKVNGSLTENNLSAYHSLAFMMPSISSIMSFLTLGIYWVGALLIDASGTYSGKLGLFSDMVVFSSYAMQVVMAFIMMVIVFMMLPRATVAAGRILEVINAEPTVEDGVSEGPSDTKGEVEFRDVSFRYAEGSDDVLGGISFKASKGETVAIIGSTGCGKSTLVNLIPRFYDVSGGQVLVDGIDVREYRKDALRSKIGYVSQKSILFSGTVADNVRFGRSSESKSDDDVRKALDVAQATEFVSRMEGGIEAHIAQGGTNISGGQKQRLSIARAVCMDPEIYIFDDSFSALDYKTDRTLRRALRDVSGDATVFIVAQRIGTIRDADTIIVLDDGRIAGMGTHEELMSSCDTYREIARSQLSEEELQ